VRNYLVLAHWMAADHVSMAFVSPVRVVCSNTLRLAERMAQVRVDLAPTGGVRERVAEHLQQALSRTQRQSILIRSAFDRLAARSVDATEAASVLAATYPNDDGWLRRAVLHLFHGVGRGIDHPAARGTLWGLYNAIENSKTLTKAARMSSLLRKSCSVGARQ